MADSSRIEDLRRRVLKDPASIAFAQLAEECRRAGDLEEAVSVSRAGLALHPTYLSARVTLGRALLELNQLSEAQTELQQVLRSAPENLAALRALAETLHRQGDLSNSLAQYRVALSLAKNDPDLQDTVASLEHQLEAAAMVPEPAAAPDTAAPPEDIFAFLRAEAPPITEAATETSTTESSVLESLSAIEPPAVEIPAVVEPPSFEALAVDAPAVVEPVAFEAPAIVDSPAVEVPAVAESLAVEAPMVVESLVEESTVVELAPVEALAVVESPAIEALAVVERPAIEALTVVEQPAIEALTIVEPPEPIETVDPVTAGDFERLWAEPVPPLPAHQNEATTAPVPQIQWPMTAEPEDPDDFFFAAPPVALEPEPVVPVAYRLARERDARTVVVLEQWLQAVHVSRTHRRA
jgi:hypothetical protein